MKAPVSLFIGRGLSGEEVADSFCGQASGSTIAGSSATFGGRERLFVGRRVTLFVGRSEGLFVEGRAVAFRVRLYVGLRLNRFPSDGMNNEF